MASPTITQTRQCCRCKTTKPLNEFYRAGHGRHRARCKACCRESQESSSREYAAWHNAKTRCYSKAAPNYRNYGGRGIVMCDRWRNSFAAFLADMGPCPSSRHELDRFPNQDGHYEVGNCRWATPQQQHNNTRVNRRLSFGGITRTMTEWTRHTGLSVGTITARLNRGWTVERALTTPLLAHGVERHRLISHQGEQKTLAQWARTLGVSRKTLRRRLDHGWTIHDTLSLPVNQAASMSHVRAARFWSTHRKPQSASSSA